ncbi:MULTISPECIES: bifunctional glutamate--cysteine ligase GshA/glutathione synthetase GshB [unclassified Clostridium]|uniref:bifunctional glutamate--cysteine ligase GshA/glutathione synthetase GshB n=1 Tax=Clostridium TaxID=1485 RepID=UPI001C8C720C|nr:MULTISPECIES: bifunctional glutamate--cysteine ligase GshA/glutathione synthetase GshB [unclassified Clostridium]MBX9136944.1 bifunctional glutamate--cysteine ligase GshA/glutathione synthetase GshB [Clostridium sp. K12(2020)]MBX9143738.1 bifunctional glutamate--cysteine ligase GshA/glutathione synthetase GshB [Clostridium sp. K13]MDU2291060.1 bifunctional glutamate--cysteine ligase GshA/glutathione synthetase GshB [Clostridium celatum]
MLNKIKKLFSSKEILSGNFGIERETLRLDENGYLAKSDHPEEFGDKAHNPYITTDFSESQIEVITPALPDVIEAYNFTRALYDIVAMEIGDEYLWPESMPCIIPDDKDIPVAKFADHSKESQEYREKLLLKYGGKKQLISGIHYNFSFNESIIEKLYEDSEKNLSYKEFKNSIYLKVARNYLRFRWLIVYLLGAAPVVHESFVDSCKCPLKKVSNNEYSSLGAISHRNGKCGYKNKVDLFPSYNSVNEYIESIDGYIKDEIIESHKELYSQVRLKPSNTKNFKESLLNEGIKYLEYRTIDINPFEKGGISLADLRFLQVFNIYLLTKEESEFENWQEEALENQQLIAVHGIDNIELKHDGKCINRIDFGLEILNEVMGINNELNLGFEDVIKDMIDKVKDSKLTYAYKITQKINEEGYINTFLSLAKGYKESAYKNRFKLEGYEDLELSTQILMKESIKRGITVNVVDRSENFISLKKDEKIEYVKQATKTSKDTYVSVLIMENKTVTKKVLAEKGVKVPRGEEFNTIEEAKIKAHKYINKPIVIKPKSTNFGIGINIFPEGANLEDIIHAFEIAFKNDTTVLIEEFIKGKEYRFLVINDEVVGILHRVPANIIGDGGKSIKELVEVKNQDPLRGKGYVTPLEKIRLEENAELFLKQQGKNFDYIPKKDEIVYLRENSNISTGGDSVDYTDDIPQKFKDIAVNASKAAGAMICGVDMMLEDYRDENTNYAIIELNFNPAIHIHSYPYKGKERKIATHVLKLLDLI